MTEGERWPVKEGLVFALFVLWLLVRVFAVFAPFVLLWLVIVLTMGRILDEEERIGLANLLTVAAFVAAEIYAPTWFD
jgi:hypothetical protein